jgi:hypothetical protein
MKRTLFLFLLLAAPLCAQQKGEPISVHVREVQRIQDENADEHGNWFHLTAVVETKTVVYTLKCDEYYSTPNHKFSLSCVHLSAGKDYSAFKFPTAINFWAKGEAAEGTRAMHEIVSEKEK